MQSIFAYSNIPIPQVDPLLVFRVTPWNLLFPLLTAGHPLIQAVDEVSIHIYTHISVIVLHGGIKRACLTLIIHILE